MEPEPRWSCATCNVMIPRSMYAQHMRTDAHIMRVREQNSSFRPPAVPPDFVKNQYGPQQQQQQQQQQHQHQQQRQQRHPQFGNSPPAKKNSYAGGHNTAWYCVVCEIYMQVICKGQHLEGKPHAAKLVMRGLARPVPVPVPAPALAPAAAPAAAAVKPEAKAKVEVKVEVKVEEKVEEVEVVGQGGEGEEQVIKEEKYEYEGEGEDEYEDEDGYDEEEEEEEVEEADDLIDWPEIPNQTSASMSWRCVACDETMNVFFKDEHLSDKAHIKKARGKPPPSSQDGWTAPEPTTPFNGWTAPEPTVPFSMTWRCMICDETMSVFFKEEHQSSKRHLKTLRTQGSSQGSITSRDVPESVASVYWTPSEHDIEANGVSSSPGSVIDTPTRARGGRAPMVRKWQQATESRFSSPVPSGDIHDPMAAFEDQTTHSPQPALPIGTSPHITCSSPHAPEPKAQGGGGMEATADWSVTPTHNQIWGSTTAQWTCTTCSLTIAVGERDAHLASAGHVAKCSCSDCLQKRLTASQEPPTQKKETADVAQHSDERAETPSDEQTQMPIRGPSQFTPGMFYCGICDAEFLLEYKWMHLSKSWECKICDKWLHHDWKDTHLERHTKRADTPQHTAVAESTAGAVSALDEFKASPAAPGSAAGGSFYCAVCDSTVKTEFRGLHQGAGWYCTVCNLTVHIPGKSGHIISRKHNRKLEEQTQHHEMVDVEASEPQLFPEDWMAAGEEQAVGQPAGLIDLLGDVTDAPVWGFPPIPPRIDQQLTESDSWDLVFGTVEPSNREVDLLGDVREPEPVFEDHPQSTDGSASVTEGPPDHESTYGSQSTLQELEEIGDPRPSTYASKSTPPEPEEIGDPQPSTYGSQSTLQELKEVKDTPPAGSPWECRLCLRTMHYSSKFSHLAGIKHKERQRIDAHQRIEAANYRTAQAKANVVGPPSIPDVPNIPAAYGVPVVAPTPQIIDISTQIPAPVDSETFHCVPCNRKIKMKYERVHKTRQWECTVCGFSLHLAWRPSHITGSKHLANLDRTLRHELAVEPAAAEMALEEFYGAVRAESAAAAPAPIVQTEPAAAAPAVPNPPRRLKLPVWVRKLRTLQRVQALHADWLKQLEATMPEIIEEVYENLAPPPRPPRNVSKTWRCIVCEIVTPTDQKEAHLASIPHASKLALEQKVSSVHPNGAFFIQVREIKNVYNHVTEILAQAWPDAGIELPRGGDTWVTPLAVKAAVDASNWSESA